MADGCVVVAPHVVLTAFPVVPTPLRRWIVMQPIDHSNFSVVARAAFEYEAVPLQKAGFDVLVCVGAGWGQRVGGRRSCIRQVVPQNRVVQGRLRYFHLVGGPPAHKHAGTGCAKARPAASPL